MATDNLATLDGMSAEEVTVFFPKYKEFMAKQVPNSNIGMSKVIYKCELSTKAFVLSVETNKALNLGSSSMLRHLTKGFISGWEAKKK